jgi:hypothetical protein
MAINPNVSDLDVNQVVKRSFDPEHDATRIIYAKDHEMAISISAEDKDSVESVPRSLIVSDSSEVSAIRFKSMALYGKSPARVEASPLDSGDVWVTVLSATDSPVTPVVHLCARRVRLVSSEPAYLVLQS